MKELINNIFSMHFDIIIPLSFILIALAIAVILFCIRYFSFMRLRRKFMDRTRQEQDPVELAMIPLESALDENSGEKTNL